MKTIDDFNFEDKKALVRVDFNVPLNENLEVTDVGFAVTLNFGDAPEPLYIPYDSIKTFVDPSVEFGLRFETQDEDGEDDPDPDDGVETETDEEETHHDADVVSLDAFRKH